MKSKKITYVLLFIYLFFLTWIILFKMQFDISILINMNFRNINLIPFAGSIIINDKVNISEIVLNVLAFVPFGIYISMIKENWSTFKKIIPVFILSFVYETMQYIFAIGASDITDLIGNTLGGVIGIIIFALCSKVFKDKNYKILNILALSGTIIAVVFIGIIIIVNI